MRGWGRTALTGAAVVALTSGAGAPVEAQQQGRITVTAPTRAEEGSSWLGFSLDVEHRRTGEREVVDLRVTNVAGDGPAARAGLRAGDRIVRINGRTATATQAKGLRRLQPGERVSLTVERDGLKGDLLITAERRPADRLTLLPTEVARRIETSVKRLDSLRIHVRFTHGGPQGFRFELDPNDGGTYVVDGLGQIVELSRLVGLADLARMGGLESVTDTGAVVHVRFENIEQAARGQVEANQLLRESAEHVRAVMVAAPSRSEAPLPARVPSPPGTPAPVRAQVAPGSPLVPYLVGERLVAGAALTVMSAGLARYFGTEEGLLVTDVVPQTPAAQAGLRPGDIVLRVGDQRVSDLTAIRVALSRAGRDAVPLTVLREERRIRITLRLW